MTPPTKPATVTADFRPRRMCAHGGEWVWSLAKSRWLYIRAGYKPCRCRTPGALSADEVTAEMNRRQRASK